MTCQDIIDLCEQQSPSFFAADWDKENIGLSVGDRSWPVTKIYLALDPTEEVIDDAISQGADMVLTHHPLIFGGIRKANGDTSVGRRILALAQNKICCYAMHTNFDVKGMAQLASSMIGLQDPEVLEVTFADDEGEEGIGRVGRLPKPVTLKELAMQLKDIFELDHIKLFGDPDRVVQRAAISPGSGKSMVPAAQSAGAEVLISGDIDHHTGIDSVAEGMAVLDAGHYGIEHIFVPYMYDYLTKQFQEKDMPVEVAIKPKKHPFLIF